MLFLALAAVWNLGPPTTPALRYTPVWLVYEDGSVHRGRVCLGSSDGGACVVGPARQDSCTGVTVLHAGRKFWAMASGSSLTKIAQYPVYSYWVLEPLPSASTN